MNEDLTDWKKVTEMTEAEIEASAKADPDCQPTDDDFWDDATVVKSNTPERKPVQNCQPCQKCLSGIFWSINRSY